MQAMSQIEGRHPPPPPKILTSQEPSISWSGLQVYATVKWGENQQKTKDEMFEQITYKNH